MSTSSERKPSKDLHGAAPLEAVISTAELQRRPARPPDFEAENRALGSLAEDMVQSPSHILQRLVETALLLCRAGSCGVSIIEDDGGAGIFRWHALVGALAKHIMGTTPRNFSPCGTVVDTNAIQLMSNIHRHFTYFSDVNPAILEALLVPFAVGGRTVGTIWVVMHDPNSHFDAEDGRLLANLGRFAAAAYQAKSSLETIAASDRRKTEFLATLAHELRNPLAAAQTASEYLKARLDDSPDPALQNVIAVQRRQLKAMGRLIDDLMDVSRITQDKLELRRERCDLASVIRDAIEECRPAIERAQHILETKLPSESSWVDGDPTRLTQVVANLLHNATKFTPPKGGISISMEREGEYFAVSVRDTGVGIAPAMLARIFEPFEQVEIARKRAQGGLGIGLSLVKRLTELHEGTVRVHSFGEGRGSVFTIRIPVAHGFAESPELKTEAQQLPDGLRLRILVVDDNKDAADTLCMLLAREGHEARGCYDGVAALAEVANFGPDVLLQDISMPGIDGLEIARRLRAATDNRGMVLVAVSGFGGETDLRRSRDAGFAQHIVKPVDFQRLRSLLGSIAEHIPTVPAKT